MSRFIYLQYTLMAYESQIVGDEMDFSSRPWRAQKDEGMGFFPLTSLGFRMTKKLRAAC